MDKGEAVWVLVHFECSLMHETADGIVCHHEAVKLLPHQIRSLAAEHDFGTPQMSLEFIQRRLSGKGLARYTDVRPVSSPSP